MIDWPCLTMPHWNISGNYLNTIRFYRIFLHKYFRLGLDEIHSPATDVKSSPQKFGITTALPVPDIRELIHANRTQLWCRNVNETKSGGYDNRESGMTLLWLWEDRSFNCSICSTFARFVWLTWDVRESEDSSVSRGPRRSPRLRRPVVTGWTLHSVEMCITIT